MALAALKDRKMIPASDGTLIPWVSDGGKPMRIAAAQPDIPWTDLAYSLQPNGHTLDYVVDSPYMQRGRIGVMKQSFVAGLYATGQATSNYAPPGTDPDADLTTWYASINAGEPYDTNPLSQDIVDEITTHHSSYYIDDSTAPGAAADLATAGPTTCSRPTRRSASTTARATKHPGTPVSLIFTDHGHQRGQNKVPDATFRSRAAARLVRLLRQGQRPAAVPGRADADAGLRRAVRAARPGRSTTRTPTSRSGPRPGPRSRPGEVRFDERGREDDRCRRSADQAGAGLRPDRRRRRLRHRAAAPTRPAPPATASTRRRPAASR